MSSDIEESLRQALRDSDKSNYEIWKATGIAQSQLSYFMHGQRSMTMANGSKLAAFLGMTLVLETKPTKKKGGKK